MRGKPGPDAEAHRFIDLFNAVGIPTVLRRDADYPDALERRLVLLPLPGGVLDRLPIEVA